MVLRSDHLIYSVLLVKNREDLRAIFRMYETIQDFHKLHLAERIWIP